MPLAVQDYVKDVRNKTAYDNRTPEELDKALFGEE
jgi:hypothetical protein